jgi:hypothetical protein
MAAAAASAAPLAPRLKLALEELLQSANKIRQKMPENVKTREQENRGVGQKHKTKNDTPAGDAQPQAFATSQTCTGEISHIAPDTPHLTPHTSHITHHTSQLTQHTPQLNHVTPHTSNVTRHTSHLTRHTSHVTPHTSHVTRHTSHVTRHTSHVTRHTSHVTRHTLRT